MDIAFMVLGLLLLAGFLAGFVYFGVINLRNLIGYVPVPRRLLPQIISALDLKPTDVLYDLGCGDGRMLRAAVRSNGSITARGVENNPVVYLAARLKCPRSIRLRCDDLFRSEIGDATVVFAYLHPHLNRRLGIKLAAGLPFDARVVSLHYPIPGWAADGEINLIAAPEHATRLYLYRRP